MISSTVTRREHDGVSTRALVFVALTASVAASLAVAAPGVCQEPPWPEEPSVFDTHVELLTFDTGLRAVVAAVPPGVRWEAETVSEGRPIEGPRAFVGLYLAGYGNEREGRQGEAHYLEHIVSNAPPSRRDYRVPDDLAVFNSNASTRSDYVSLWMTVTATPEAIDALVASRLNRLSGVEVSEELVETEKQRVARELRGMADFERFHADHLLLRALFGDSADLDYEIGLLDEFTPAETERLMARRLDPARAVLVVAGDIDVDEVRAIVERRAVALEGARRDSRWVEVRIDPPGGAIERMIEGAEVRHVGMAFRLPPRASDEYLAYVVLDRLLLGDRPLPGARSVDELTRSLDSPLARRLVQRVGAHAVWDGESYGTADPPLAETDPAFYRLHVTTRRAHAPETIAVALREALADVAATELTDAAIEHAKEETVTFYRRWLSGPFYRALGDHLAGLTMFGRGPERLRDLPAEMMAVRPATVRRVMRQQLLAAPEATVLLRPLEASSDTPVYLELGYDADELEVLVNGVPVASPTAERTTYLLRLTGFLAEGENTVTVRWRSPPRSRRPLSIEVLAWPTGRARDEAAVLVRDSVVSGPDGRHSRTWRFETAPPVASPWHGATRVTTLRDTDREQILNLVRRLRDAVRNRNPERLLEFVAPALRAMSGGDPSVADRIGERYRQLMRSPGFDLHPLAEDRLSVEAHGRLTVVRVPEGPVLSTTEVAAGRLEMKRLFFAKTDGTWALVGIT